MAREPNLTVEERARVRALHKQGLNPREIGAALGRDPSSARRVLEVDRSGVAHINDWVPAPGRLGLEQREEIAVGIARDETFTTIATRLGVAVSTVSREVGGVAGRRRYRASVAHREAFAASRRPKPTKLAACPALRRRVEELLLELWSPEQISQRLRVEFPDDPMMQVSPETIYQSLFVQGRGALRRELAACLRSGRVERRPQGASRLERRGRIPGMVNISERPAEVEDRSVPGHWEGDLIMGANNRSAVGTLVERATRFVMLLHLPDGADAASVRDAMAATIVTLPEALRRSITWDQGKEMAEHARFRAEHGIDIYFCDPHSPWQRGSNENTNGLLRQYLPKGTDLSAHTKADLQAIADSLNGRPRKTLGWMTPSEKLAEVLAATT